MMYHKEYIYDYKYQESISMVINNRHLYHLTYHSNLSQSKSLQQQHCLTKVRDSLPFLTSLFVKTPSVSSFPQCVHFLLCVLLIANHLVIQAGSRSTRANFQGEIKEFKAGFGVLSR